MNLWSPCTRPGAKDAVARYQAIPQEARVPGVYRDVWGRLASVPVAGTRQPPPTDEPALPRDEAAEAAALKERARHDESLW